MLRFAAERFLMNTSTSTFTAAMTAMTAAAGSTFTTRGSMNARRNASAISFSPG